MSKGGGGGGSSTTVQKADPWVGVQGPLKQLYAGAQNWYQGGGPQYYPGQTVAGTNGAQQMALDRGTQMASQGPGQFFKDAQYGLNQTGNGAQVGSNPAQTYFQGSTDGHFLNEQTNPYLSGMFQSAARPMIDQFQRAIAPGIASQFSLAGRTGSGAHQAAFQGAEDSLGKSLGDMGTNMYGQAYENERNRQQAAAGQLSSMNQFDRTSQQAAQMAAPQFENMKYNDLDKMLGIGEYQRNVEQQFMDAAKQRWDFGQNQPLQNLQGFNSILTGATPYGDKTTNEKTAQNKNPFASGLGGAFMANALGNTMGGAAGGAVAGPWGMLGGALLGGLFG